MLKSAVCLRIAVTVVAKTSCVVTEFPDAALFVRKTYYGQRRHFSSNLFIYKTTSSKKFLECNTKYIYNLLNTKPFMLQISITSLN